MENTPDEDNGVNREQERRTRGRYGQDIVALAQELQRLRETSTDIVATTKDLKAVQTRDGIILTGVQDMPEATGMALDVPGFGTYPLTHHGHQQLAEKTGIPFRYYEAMQGARFYDLVAENVNRWLSVQADRRLVRVADGKVRAVLSDRYRVLDNYDLAMLVMDRAVEHAAIVQASDLTETRMYIKLVVPEYTAKLAFTEEEKRAHTWHGAMDDEVIPGLVVSNSEVGDGAFRVEPFLFRKVCSNGVILEESLYKVHLGSRLEVGELIYSDETRKLADAALWSKVRDIIDATFDEKLLKSVIARMAATKTMPLEKPQEVVDAVVQGLQLSETRKLDLIRYFAKESDTVFGLVNGITRLAQDFEDTEDQVRLERYAGAILAKPAAIMEVA